MLDGSWRAHATLPARGLPALQCRLVCDAGGSGVGRDGREARKFSSVQFSSVQFSSVQFSSIQIRAPTPPSSRWSALTRSHARMHACTGSRQPCAVECRTAARQRALLAAAAARCSRFARDGKPFRWPLSRCQSSKTCSSSCCYPCSTVNKGSRAILLPHSGCKQHWQPEWTAAKRCSSSVGRDEIRREGAAGIQQQQPASSSTKALCHVEACAHHARRWPMCDVTVALAPGAAVLRGVVR